MKPLCHLRSRYVYLVTIINLATHSSFFSLSHHLPVSLLPSSGYHHVFTLLGFRNLFEGNLS